MTARTTQGRDDVEALARETGFGPEAIESMRASLVRGGGRMAQFDHPEFGGSGQWMHGGMLMISDLFDGDLKRRVGHLCETLAGWVADPVPAARTTWTPAALGVPDTSGAQNEMRYAWFATARRLAIDDGHGVTVYDTGDHRIGGVSQQQGGRRTLSFFSQHGVVDLDRLPVVEGDAAPANERPATPRSEARAASDATGPGLDPFVALEKLAALHAKGIVGDDDFAAKRTELLGRI